LFKPETVCILPITVPARGETEGKEIQPVISKELVRSAIYFQGPERLPMDMYISGPSDVLHAHGGEGSYRRTSDGGEAFDVDHFGCQFAVLNNKTMGQPTNFPIKDIKELDAYRFPDPRDEGRLGPIGTLIGDNREKYVSTSIIWFTFFERMHFLHGFTQTLEELFLEKDLMLEFADRIIEYNIAAVKELHRRYPGRVDGVSMSDDWGTQDSTVISLKLFREFFMPRYKRLFGAIRDCGMDVWLHSCGYVVEFIPSFIEMGVQVLNLQQPRIFDLAELESRDPE
jgi:hypothetical protein